MTWQVQQQQKQRRQKSQPFSVSMQLQPATDTDSGHVAAMTSASDTHMQPRVTQPKSGATSAAGADAAADAASADTMHGTSRLSGEGEAQNGEEEAGPSVKEPIAASSSSHALHDASQHCSSTCTGQQSGSHHIADGEHPISAIPGTQGAVQDLHDHRSDRDPPHSDSDRPHSDRNPPHGDRDPAHSISSSKCGRQQGMADLRGADGAQQTGSRTGKALRGAVTFRDFSGAATMDCSTMMEAWQDATASRTCQLGASGLSLTASTGKSSQVRIHNGSRCNLQHLVYDRMFNKCNFSSCPWGTTGEPTDRNESMMEPNKMFCRKQVKIS